MRAALARRGDRVTSGDEGSAVVGPISSNDFDGYPSLSEDDSVLALIEGIQVRITTPR